mmetsp:Transcript_18086/g.72418  ORF Transcript_18086/g.72418 Transcript_18086/m.72418 type:complete len:328 (+) Transcript_18086:29-1012(+)
MTTSKDTRRRQPTSRGGSRCPRGGGLGAGLGPEALGELGHPRRRLGGRLGGTTLLLLETTTAPGGGLRGRPPLLLLGASSGDEVVIEVVEDDAALLAGLDDLARDGQVLARGQHSNITTAARARRAADAAQELVRVARPVEQDDVVDRDAVGEVDAAARAVGADEHGGPPAVARVEVAPSVDKGLEGLGPLLGRDGRVERQHRALLAAPVGAPERVLHAPARLDRVAEHERPARDAVHRRSVLLFGLLWLNPRRAVGPAEAQRLDERALLALERRVGLGAVLAEPGRPRRRPGGLLGVPVPTVVVVRKGERVVVRVSGEDRGEARRF